jgi:Protein of unknown function (DUF1566)
MEQGAWRDQRTGLVWARCPVGQRLSGSDCSGKKIVPTYRPDPGKNGSEMVQALSGFDLTGFKDWRLPTIAEYQALLPCADGTIVPEAAGETIHFTCPNGKVPTLDARVFPDVRTREFQPVAPTASASDKCGGPCYKSLNWMTPYIGSDGKVRWQGTKIMAVRSDTPLNAWSALQKSAPGIIRAQQLADAEEAKRRQVKEDQDRREAEAQAKTFLSLGKCAVGEIVIHRELVNASQSSGNLIADAIWNSHTKAQYVIEYEAIVEGFLGGKVKTTVNGYAVKQLSKGSYVDASGMRANVSSIADKLVGKNQFYERSRCAK